MNLPNSLSRLPSYLEAGVDQMNYCLAAKNC